MPNLDDTQPRLPAAFPDRPTHFITPDEDNADDGPGCLVWSVVFGFMLLLALGVVGLAGLAGWNEGLRVAIGNATATQSSEIVAQCARIPQDLASGSFGLAQRRFESLGAFTPPPPCVAQLAPTATAAYLASLPTNTPTPTPTLLPSSTPTPEVTQEPSTPFPTSASGFDLNKLLAEAQQLLSAGKFNEAIDTLDALAAIDHTFETVTVDRLLYQALTSEARNLFRSGQNLAQAILLTNRAEQYGNVGDLSYERYIAELYLQAQIYRDVNFAQAIRLLTQIVYQQDLTNYMGGEALRQLNNQTVKYADLLAQNGDYCGAQAQYDSALSMFPNTDVSNKRAAAAAACASGVIGATQDPLAPVPTSDPNAPAPIGQRP